MTEIRYFFIHELSDNGINEYKKFNFVTNRMVKGVYNVYQV